MPNIRFRSLSSAAYSIAVSQSGADIAFSPGASENPDPRPSNPDPRPSESEVLPSNPDHGVALSVNRTSGTAPSAFWFEAKATGFDVENPDHDLLYVWDFDDAGAEYANLSGRLSAIPVFKDANVAYGPWVTHAFRNPRTYSVTCTVHNGINAPVVSDPIQITVEDPDTVFGDERTVYVSNGSDFTGVPAGAKTLTTADFKAGLNAISAPRRVLFKRGDTFTAPGAQKGLGKSWIGDWGNPADPQPEIDTAGASDTAHQFVARDSFDELIVRNITGRGSYSPVTQTGAGGGFSVWESARGNIIYDHCKSIGNNSGFTTATSLNERSESSIAYLDCEVTDWLNYGIFGGFHRGAFLGTWVHCNPDGYKVDMNSGGGAGMRIERTSGADAGFTYFGCTDVFMNYAGRFSGDQPGYKLQGDALPDARFNVDRQITEGSTNTNQGVGSTVPERQNAIYDKIIHIGTAQCGVPISIQNSGTTYRNFFFAFPHVKFEKGGINPFAMAASPAGSSQRNVDGFFKVYGGTVVHWMDWATHAGLRDVPFQEINNPDVFGRQVVSNIIVHAPFATTPQVCDVDTSAPLEISAFYKGRKLTSENGGKLQPEYATPARFSWGGHSDQPFIAAVKPKGTSLEADIGPDKMVPIDYIDGTLRGKTPAKGAFRP